MLDLSLRNSTDPVERRQQRRDPRGGSGNRTIDAFGRQQDRATQAIGAAKAQQFAAQGFKPSSGTKR
jgi:hypothetical protein